jgi:hypothetical protein
MHREKRLSQNWQPFGNPEPVWKTKKVLQVIDLQHFALLSLLLK